MPLLGNPSCKLCDRGQSAPLICVMGTGPTDAKIMVFGEAPTIHRKDLTRAFSGNAGKLLDKIFIELGQARDEMYLTNVVHCAAQDNETPTNPEIKACKIYTDQEISEVKPRYILILGASALKGVLGKVGITELHGHPIEKDGITYFPTFHPSAALRDPNKVDVIKADLRKFFEIVDGSWKPATGLNLTTVKSFEDVNNMVADLKECPVVGFDLETSGLDSFDPEGFITVLGISRYRDEALTDEKQYAIPFTLPNSPFPKKEVQKQIVELIASAVKGKKIVAHNGKFDNLWLYNQYGIRFHLTYDTMLAAHILDENQPVGLKYLAGVHLGAHNYDLTSEEKRGAVETRRLLEYNGYDTMYTLRLYKFQRPQLMKEQGLLKLFMYLIMPLARTFEEVEMHGTYVYTERLGELEELLEGRLTVAQAGLDELAQGVNWASTKQVAEILFGKWGLKPLETTKSGAPSTAESILLRLRSQHKGVDLLLQHREVSKQLSSFVDGWKEFIRDSRMHPSFKIHGTVTGRLSCSSPNLQQVPRDTKIRSLIGAPPGWKLLEGDLSQIELRIATILSKDPLMTEVFNNASDDIHRRTAAVVTGKPPDQITKDERKKAKAINFGFLYGMGPKKFLEYARDKYQTDLTLDEATKFREQFFHLYTGLLPWHARQRSLVKQFMQVKSLDGRIRHLPEIMSPADEIRSQAERNAINSPVQGLASDLNCMALIEIHETLPRDRIRVIGAVHDAILCEVREDYIKEALVKVKAIMEHPKLLDKFGIEFPIPIISDVKVSRGWGLDE